MSVRFKVALKAAVIFLSSGIYFTLAYVGYSEQNIKLDEIDKFTGTVIDRGITDRQSGKGNTTVFYIQIEGLNETLGIYRMNGRYNGLVNNIKPGDEVTAYYISRGGGKVNIDLVQLERQGEILINAEEYKNKESALIYIGLIAGLLSVGGSILYYKKNIG